MKNLLNSLSWNKVANNLTMLVRFAILEALLVVGLFFNYDTTIWFGIYGIIFMWYFIDIISKIFTIGKYSNQTRYIWLGIISTLFVILHVVGIFHLNYYPQSSEIYDYISISKWLAMITIWYNMLVVYINYTFSDALINLMSNDNDNCNCNCNCDYYEETEDDEYDVETEDDEYDEEIDDDEYNEDLRQEYYEDGFQEGFIEGYLKSKSK